MSDDEQNPFHLPSPSGLPLVTSLGIALLLAGIIPDELLWRMAIMSIGFTITVIGLWGWVQDAIDEYRNLPD